VERITEALSLRASDAPSLGNLPLCSCDLFLAPEDQATYDCGMHANLRPGVNLAANQSVPACLTTQGNFRPNFESLSGSHPVFNCSCDLFLAPEDQATYDCGMHANLRPGACKVQCLSFINLAANQSVPACLTTQGNFRPNFESLSGSHPVFGNLPLCSCDLFLAPEDQATYDCGMHANLRPGACTTGQQRSFQASGDAREK
jgi:ferredoxin-thioredoxin reductase catalytic subunit